MNGADPTRRIATGESAPYGWTLTRGVRPHRDVLSFAIETPLNCTAGGFMQNVYTSVGFTPSPNWLSASSLYQVARTLRMEIYYVPNNKYDLAANAVTGLLLIGNDFELATAASSYNALLDYDQVTIANSGDQIYHTTVPPKGPPYDTWYQTSAPVATFWPKFYGQGFGALQGLGNLVIRWIVELEGLT